MQRKIYLGWLCSLIMLGAGRTAAQQADSIVKAIEPDYDAVSNMHRFWLGENYRKLWATPVKMRVLRLTDEKGGLKVVKLGGGMQTRSLRLEDPTGRQYVLRTIQKYPERGLPENLRPTIAKDILQDQVSTGHPYAALVVPPLARALGLAHAKPEVVYVADDEALGEYRKTFSNAVYLFEERNPDETDDTDNTSKVQRKLEEDNDFRVDQRQVLRARLLDFLLGDWDRHEDNWRWVADKKKGHTLYAPVPRDRDKVFYKTTGVFPWILSHQWLKSNLQPYDENIRDIAGWNFNARYFDRYFLNELSKQDWINEAAWVKKRLTDSIVSYAIHQMPDTIYRLNGESLRKTFLARRDKLSSFAGEYYSFLARVVDVPLSAGTEIVSASSDGDSAAVRVFNRKKDGSQGRLLYERAFLKGETRELRLYGMGGNDDFKLERSHLPFKIRWIPGTGDSVGNVFNRRSFKFDRHGPMALVNYSIDQGFQLKAGYIWEKQGFRKEPFAMKHELWASYSTGRNSWMFNYDGRFTDVIGKADLLLQADVLGPNNLSNFFGIGNDLPFNRHDDGRSISFFRNRMDHADFNILLENDLSKQLKLRYGISTELYASKSVNNGDRFLGEFDQQYPGEHVFRERFQAGALAELEYDSCNSASVPSSGLHFVLGISGKRQLNAGDNDYGRIQGVVSHYFNIADEALVIANRAGGGTLLGKPAFYQLMRLGGVHSLRGMHTGRYAGNSIFYHNLDLRLRLFHFSSYIMPGTVGLLAFHDLGRVWAKGERSSRWHNGYGAGLYILPADLLVIQGSVGFSKDGALPYISVGFSF